MEEGDYIVIEEIGHTTDLYEGGKKFMIKNLKEGSFEIDGEIAPDKTKKLRWCLGKDDVTPQDIFKLANEGPAGRAIVGKYCIKDTTLIHDLMRKVDTMNHNPHMLLEHLNINLSLDLILLHLHILHHPTISLLLALTYSFVDTSLQRRS